MLFYLVLSHTFNDNLLILNKSICLLEEGQINWILSCFGSRNSNISTENQFQLKQIICADRQDVEYYFKTVFDDKCHSIHLPNR